MSTLQGLQRRLRNALRRDAATRELEEEMRLHRALRAESLRASGAAADDAAREATLRFGNAPRLAEESRDAWGWSSPDELRQDVRYAARRLWQRPGFSASVCTVLALGIGATTAMFSAVDAAMLRPLPFLRPSELFTLPNVNIPFDPGPGKYDHELSFDITEPRGMTETFASVDAYGAGGLNLGMQDRPVRVRVGVVTQGFFATLGVQPVRGRSFGDADVVPGAARTVVLSWRLWQDQFGGRDMIDSLVPLNDRQYRVVGIMPRRFSFPSQSDVWLPMTVPTTPATFEPFRGFLMSTTIARLAPGVSPAVAEARLRAHWDRFIATVNHPDYWKGTIDAIRTAGATIPLQQTLVGSNRRALWVLFGATGCLLLIACANVTNLLLSYGAGRRREIAVRAVLGATRARVVRQLLTESVLLSVCGALLGIALAPALLQVLSALMPAELAGVSAAQVDLRVLSFAVIVALAAGVAFGLWPALGSARTSSADAMKSGGGHGATSAGTRRAQRVLVGAELALAVALLVGAGLMLRSFRALMLTDSGLDAERVATMEMSFPLAIRRDARIAKVDGILDQLRTTPGVVAAAAINDLPLAANNRLAIGVTIPAVGGGASEQKYVRYLVVSDDYFRTMGIAMLSGRTFTRSDGPPAPKVVIINAAMARRFWPGMNAVGHTFTWGGDSLPVTVIGVAANVREGALADSATPQMFFPMRTQLGQNVAIVVRGAPRARALLTQLRGAVLAVDRTQAVYNVRMMSDVIGASVASRRANTTLISIFGALALVVSALGVYAVTSYAVAQRTRELGIRAALGATRSDLARHIGTEIAWSAVAGIVAGAALAWALSRVLSSFLYGVTVHDAAAFAIAPLVLLGAAAAATVAPTWRAMRVDPSEVIRSD